MRRSQSFGAPIGSIEFHRRIRRTRQFMCRAQASEACLQGCRIAGWIDNLDLSISCIRDSCRWGEMLLHLLLLLLRLHLLLLCADRLHGCTRRYKLSRILRELMHWFDYIRCIYKDQENLVKKLNDVFNFSAAKREKEEKERGRAGNGIYFLENWLQLAASK